MTDVKDISSGRAPRLLNNANALLQEFDLVTDNISIEDWINVVQKHVTICVIYFRKYLWKVYYMLKIPKVKGCSTYPLTGNLAGIREIQRGSTYLSFFAQVNSFTTLWYGPFPVLFVNDADIAQTVLTNPNSLNKGSLIRFAIYPIFKESLAFSQVERWKKVRKLFNYAFTKQILDSFIPIFNNISEILEQQMEVEIGKEPFDVYQYVGRGTLDAICRTAMCVNFNMQKSDCVYFDAVHRIAEIIFERVCRPWLYPHSIFSRTSLGKELRKNIEIIFSMTNKVFTEKWNELNKNKKSNLNIEDENIRQQMKKNPLKLSFLEFVIELVKMNPDIISKEKLMEEVNFIILAGYETTALSLSNIILSLACLKHIQDKVYEEIYEVFGDSDRPVEVNDLPKLKYMEMVIKESMRLFPSIVQIIRKPSLDFMVDKYKVPGGVDVLISILAIHRNPKYWKDPSEFIPERFSPEEIENRHPFAYLPFGAGLRNCIGGKYAIMFMKIVLAYILRKYEFHTHLKLSELDHHTFFTMKLVGGHLVKIKKRDHSKI